MTPITIYFILLLEFFVMGLMVGEVAAHRNPPNEPKPKKFSDMLHKEYMKGYDAGVKATLNQMRVEIKRSDERRW